MGVRPKGGGPRMPVAALAGAMAEAAVPLTEAPRGTAAAGRSAVDPPRRGAATGRNDSCSGTAETAETAETCPSASTESSSPESGDADADWSSDHPPQRGPAEIADLLTIALVKKAVTDLEHTHERSKLSRTDIVNRAISLYEFIDAELSDGAKLIVRRNGRDNLLELL